MSAVNRSHIRVQGITFRGCAIKFEACSDCEVDSIRSFHPTQQQYFSTLEDREKKRPIRRPDSRNELDDKEKQVYDAMRAWRAARAKAEGIPPYMIANNKQLAKMIRSRVQSRTALTAIQGIGDAKAAKYGEEILEILNKHLVQAPAETPEVERESQK